MDKFMFSQDTKVITWQREFFEVEANSYEEALEKVKANKKEILENEDMECIGEWRDKSLDVLLECVEPFEEGKDKKEATFEVYEPNGDLIFDNYKNK